MRYTNRRLLTLLYYMPRKYTVERIVMTLLQLMPDSKTIGTNTCFQIGARQVQIYRTHAGRLTV